MNEPHWLVIVIISAVVTILLEKSPKIYLALKERKGKSKFIGTWHCYHWTVIDNNPEIIESIFEIKNALLTGFKVYAEQKQTNLKYSGPILQEGEDRVIFLLYSKQHNERAVYRFSNPLESKNFVHGIWLSFDHDKHTASGATVLTREVIPTDERERILKSGLSMDSKIPLMRVK